MPKQITKIQKLINYVDRLLLKGLGAMMVMILIVGINSYSNSTKSNTFNNEINKATDENCTSQLQKNYIPPNDITLKTNLSKSIINLIQDTDYASIQKDGIPVLTNPPFVSTKTALDCIDDKEEVFIVIYNGLVKIYPKKILIQHQIVNDTYGSNRITIVYSPFSDSASAFLVDDIFGISGRIYKGNTLMYDKDTESLWIQLTGRAIAGDRTGEKLVKIVMQNSILENAIQAFPNAKIASFDTGYKINYKTNPYLNYQKTSLPFGKIDTREYEYDAKQIGISFEYNEEPYFFPLGQKVSSELDENLVISLNKQLASYEVYVTKKNSSHIIPSSYTYFYSYHEIYKNSNFY